VVVGAAVVVLAAVVVVVVVEDVVVATVVVGMDADVQGTGQMPFWKLVLWKCSWKSSKLDDVSSPGYH